MSYGVYSVVMHAHYGQTLGKMAAKVKVLPSSEAGVPGFRRALLSLVGDSV
ncbi:MAG: RDD family protein [Verrucomicrobiaceae bacterium]|nr:RDD family protein [Verrucomicrobiaceae bacterium]